MKKSPKSTSLWKVIDAMQRRLEAAGLEQRVVDVAVATGIEALLEVHPPAKRQPDAMPAWLQPGLAVSD